MIGYLLPAVCVNLERFGAYNFLFEEAFFSSLSRYPPVLKQAFKHRNYGIAGIFIF